MTPRTLAWLAVCGLAGLVVSACETGSSTPPAEQIPEWDGTVEVTPPTPPTLPNWSGACPDGWRPVVPDDGDGIGWCEPWPEGGPQDCARGEVHLPGLTGCVEYALPCPAGEWAEGLEDITEVNVVYVHADADPGGNGTRSRPYQTIAEATAGASHWTIIALSRGTFEESVELPGGVGLIGACVTETTIQCPEGAPFAISTGGDRTDVRLLGVTGPCQGIRVEGYAASMYIEAVEVFNVRGAGIVVRDSATVTGLGVVVRRVGSAGADGAVGLGAVARGRLSLVGVAVEEVRGFGVLGSDPATAVTLSAAVVRDGQDAPVSGYCGVGLSFMGGARGDLDQVVVTGNSGIGVSGSGADTEVDLADVVVRDTRASEIEGSQEGTVYGQGVYVELGAAMNISKVLIERNVVAGLLVSNAGTTVTVTDAVVRGTQGSPDGRYAGRGVDVEFSAHLEISRALLEENNGTGAVSINSGTMVILTDVLVRGSSAFDGGFGLFAGMASSMDITRAVIERNEGAGVIAAHLNSSISLRDVTVEGTLPSPCATSTCSDRPGGGGIISFAGAHLSAERFRSVGNALCGVQVLSGEYWDEDGGAHTGAGTMDLFDGEVSHNGVCGANVTNEGFDISRLTEGVIYYDNNGRNLDAIEMFVPSVDSLVAE